MCDKITVQIIIADYRFFIISIHLKNKNFHTEVPNNTQINKLINPLIV